MSRYKLWSFVAAAVITTIVIASLYQHQKHRPLYRQHYKSAMLIQQHDGVIMTGKCVELAVTLEIYEKTVTLSVGHDKMSGVPVKMSESGGLFVKFSDKLTLIFHRTVPTAYENTKNNELLLITGPGHTLILSHHTDCEEITTLLDEIRP
jgi:hypothetical protein